MDLCIFAGRKTYAMGESAKILTYILLILAFGVYTGFIYRQGALAADPGMQAAMQGKQIWQEKNCTACHQIYGLGGFLGPDLTNIYSAKGKGPLYIQAFVSGGTNVMPSFNLTRQEMDYLVAFLKHTDASGKSDPKIFKRNLNGTIELQ